MEHFTDRQRRWLAVCITAPVLAASAFAWSAGSTEFALAGLLAAPFLAAVLSGRTLVATIAASFGAFVVVWWFVFWSFDDGPLAMISVGAAGAFVLQSTSVVQIVARLLASFVAGFGAWSFIGDVTDLVSISVVAAAMLVAIGLADEVADVFAAGRDYGIDADVVSHLSAAQKLAYGAWASFGLAVLSYWLGIGSGLPALFVLAGVVAGVAGAVASFSTPPAEGEVRAATLAISMTPVLIVIGLIAFVLVALSTVEWTLF